ncbi:chromate transporter, chromate ion transporter (CHR) family [Caldalkalibacillus thermarum TA2.A1]|uniref:Chromate transporter, chromate ion transporter (CHR) family n=1 Tax=Caldalkalibacillus thermarum (strain TA2.A1) TaxID=986075 RepID=F5L5I4_CALTT|nr:chromate transporter [Caldalkalibacillus thermarum]EGL83382.1 chromate transporter, chromate ion transporter (CHR) family [Caldalkalibacillus thermarum TA2.A1]
MEHETSPQPEAISKGSAWEVLSVSTKLGLTSFGGPVAHLGFFREEYIKRRQWLDDRTYADLVALCQFLPGPASSQVGIGIGLIRAGFWGALAVWIGFTLPSVILMALFAFVLQGLDLTSAGWIHGLKIAALAIVAHALLGMGRSLAPDRQRASIAILAAIVILLWPSALNQIVVILAGGVIGLLLFKSKEVTKAEGLNISIRGRWAIMSLGLFFGLLLLLPLLRHLFPVQWLAMADTFYRVGSLVFGGGHVVLPLLEREVVALGWVSQEAFLAGYGAAQAIPGPLFTFAAYIGALVNGWSGALLATVAIFLPSFFLVIGALPFWDLLRRHPKIQGALNGINAAVVGILLAALYHPLWTNTVTSVADFALALISFGLIVFWKAPPWLVVILGGIGGSVIAVFTA